jgi:hypothetical protein
MTNVAPSPVPPPRRRFRALHWFFLAIAAMAVVVAVEVGSVFYLSDEASDLRVSFIESTDLEVQTKVQLSVGPGLLGLGRVVAGFIDDIPPEAKDAMTAVRRTSVGVYELARVPSEEERLKLFSAADLRMNSEGWSRIVSVQEGEQTVMIFMPTHVADGDEIEICLTVCDGRDLVIVSATTRTEPLIKLAQQQAGGWSGFVKEI